MGPMIDGITVWWVGTSWSTTQLHPSSLKNDENFGSRNANIRKMVVNLLNDDKPLLNVKKAGS